MTTFPTVWIVDDDEDDRFFLVQALRQLAAVIRIRELTDGDQVLPTLAQTPALPQLVLLDLNMPRKNGFEVLRELRNTPVYQELPVVVLTTSDSKDDQDRSLALGANDFLTKPSSQPALLALLRQVISSWRLA